MHNHIIKFSGGKSSFTVAAWVKEKYPNHNVILYFNDVMWEDEDLYRFNLEVSEKLQLPLLVQSRGITPPQLMVLKCYLANNLAGICSEELKIKVAMRFFKKGIVPEEEHWVNKQYLKQSIHVERDDEWFKNTTLYFGIGWEEAHRENPIFTNWQPFDVQFPLMEEIDDRSVYFERYNIAEPIMYKQNFTHNNCAGRCVKAGKGHHQNFLMQRPDEFYKLAEQEIVIGWYTRYVRQPTFEKIYKRFKFEDLFNYVKNPKENPLDVDPMFDEVYKYATDGTKTAKIEHILRTHQYNKNNIFGRTKKKKEDIKKPFSFMKTMTLEEFEKTAMQLNMWDVMDIGGCGCSTDYGTCQINEEDEW